MLITGQVMYVGERDWTSEKTGKTFHSVQLLHLDSGATVEYGCDETLEGSCQRLVPYQAEIDCRFTMAQGFRLRLTADKINLLPSDGRKR